MHEAVDAGANFCRAAHRRLQPLNYVALGLTADQRGQVPFGQGPCDSSVSLLLILLLAGENNKRDENAAHVASLGNAVKVGRMHRIGNALRSLEGLLAGRRREGGATSKHRFV